MKHLITDTPLCLLYSVAMVLEVEPSDLQKEVGFTGLEVWWPDLSEPLMYRGHCMQDFIEPALIRNRVFNQILAKPALMAGADSTRYKDVFMNSGERFYRLIKDKPAILLGVTKRMFHAVAWDGVKVLDPAGKDGLEGTQCAWVVETIRN